ncbi:MAG: RNA polymerase sigma factor RpoH [Rickettsiales bacterium]|nr:RNA polymerase sigma factor RpoH [Rickettsiales bacterium]
MASVNYPVLSAESGLAEYMQQIKKFPVLTAEQEYDLACKVSKEKDLESAHQLVTSHLRLVAKIANGYRGYGLPITDIISEGNIGLMQAVKRFVPEKGFRLATYAMWWIKASIQEYILRSWSLVKIGTTTAQKKLFFNLRKIKNRILSFDTRSLTQGEIQDIADELEVPVHEVVSMDQRLSNADSSLNEVITSNDRAGYDTTEKLELLEAQDSDHEAQISDIQEVNFQRQKLLEALESLNDREKDIILKRRLTEPAITLDELSQHYEVSRERIRQIEVRAFEKLKSHIEDSLVN